MAFCKNCGAEIKEGENFCMNCGEGAKEKVEAVVENTAEPVVAAVVEPATEVVAAEAPKFEEKAEEKVEYSAPKAEETVNAAAGGATTGTVPGKGKAIAALVLGLVGVVFWWFFGIFPIISLVCGIVGLVLAGGAKKVGYVGGMRTAGFILSLIALIGGAIFLIIGLTCASAVGCAACAAAASAF